MLKIFARFARTAMLRLSLRPVNDGVVAVLLEGDQPGGHLKRMGGVWKFKAMGWENGDLIPGGGPLTGQHNRCFDCLEDAAAWARLGS